MPLLLVGIFVLIWVMTVLTPTRLSSCSILLAFTFLRICEINYRNADRSPNNIVKLD